MANRVLLGLGVLGLFVGVGGVLASCSANQGSSASNGGSHGGSGGQGGAGGADPDGGIGFDGALFDANGEACATSCSVDGTQVVDCHGKVVLTCGSGEACSATGCEDACTAAKENKSSIGCEYYAVMMDGQFSAQGGCFVAFVANTFAQPAHVQATFGGQPIDLGVYAKVPAGSGQGLQYQPYAPAQGLAPGQVAILFLGGGTGGVSCPTPPAIGTAQVTGTGIGRGFRIQTDVPVVAYQMLPYGGGSAAVTGATLLLPTSAWDTNYVAAAAYRDAQAASGNHPSMDLVASEDGTEITILPNLSIVAGPGVPAAYANVPITYTLDAGQFLQITQPDELTGSPIQANKPIGLFAGHQCENAPASTSYCDHAEQQIPPVRALGSEYAAVSYRQRSGKAENPPWRIVGAVDGTLLTYEPAAPPGAPTTVNLGQVVEFATGAPFVVRSQDEKHPFLFVTYMTGSTAVDDGYGDADFVRITPSAQYLSRYVFFTDPTYPETNLVVVRRRGPSGFGEVSLDCAGQLAGWAPLGTGGAYEWTRTDLVRHDFQPQGNCNNGRHEMSSPEPFGLWVWGWGTPETSAFTANVSYGYPAGENVRAINSVVVPPTPK